MTSRPRRSSSLGSQIPFGDTGPAQSTMSTTASSKRKSQNRRRALAGKEKDSLKGWGIWAREYCFKHTWVIPLLLVLTVLLGYALNPTPTNPLHTFIFISYPRASGSTSPTTSGTSSTVFGKGLLDLRFVTFYTAVFSFTREFLTQELLRPLARRLGLRKKGKVNRFMEQAYTALYFAVFGPFGLYVMYNSPMWYFNTRAFYEGYPHKELSGEFKAYYLLQAAYWTQQAIVLLLQLEKPRKDFKELVLHHVITVSLIALSYRFHFTHIGLAVYITHDISDFFLATSKTLNYIDVSWIGPYFVLFMASWIYCRHYINLGILWSVLTEFRTVGPWVLDWEGGSYKCRIAQVITFGLLASLQAVNLFWLRLILRIARRYVAPKEGEGLKDVRSDDEDSESGGELAGDDDAVYTNGTKLVSEGIDADAVTTGVETPVGGKVRVRS
ncbi:longevity assurance proteins LAG1/LAC1 [Ascobolus immersus RN42]|uniref:Longevity assurance proteins LAG1/LAC1 n=1 Tax=Ascobolus immersus RN42 TaxID=1160509 RepID=A0A3N4HPM7_ASCIM|nr:longevity assurance proteins LAG1/LAC1 [Ascobolus immersus RN42]